MDNNAARSRITMTAEIDNRNSSQKNETLNENYIESAKDMNNNDEGADSSLKKEAFHSKMLFC